MSRVWAAAAGAAGAGAAAALPPALRRARQTPLARRTAPSYHAAPHLLRAACGGLPCPVGRGYLRPACALFCGRTRDAPSGLPRRAGHVVHPCARAAIAVTDEVRRGRGQDRAIIPALRHTQYRRRRRWLRAPPAASLQAPGRTHARPHARPRSSPPPARQSITRRCCWPRRARPQ